MAYDGFSLDGKNVLITGGTGYLGRVMSISLAKSGANVLINSRSANKCEQLVEYIRSIGLSAEPAPFDVTKLDEISCFFEKYVDLPLHGIVNNAYQGGSGTIETCMDNEYRLAFDCCVTSMHRLTKSGLPSLRRGVCDSGYASVVNVSSMYGLVSPDIQIYDRAGGSNPPYYGAAKAAMIQWTRYAACEFAKEGIRFNSITPGPFPSSDVQSENPTLVQRIRDKVPMGRVGEPLEICGPVIMYLSAASSFITGTNLCVDGGWTAW